MDNFPWTRFTAQLDDRRDEIGMRIHRNALGAAAAPAPATGLEFSEDGER